MIAAGVLVVLLVAAVPVALLVGVILMLFGHVVGGLALFGGSVFLAISAVMIAGVSGVRHVRKLVSNRAYRVVQLRQGDYDYD
jgi:hypothetical protein